MLVKLMLISLKQQSSEWQIISLTIRSWCTCVLILISKYLVFMHMCTDTNYTLPALDTHLYWFSLQNTLSRCTCVLILHYTWSSCTFVYRYSLPNTRSLCTCVLIQYPVVYATAVARYGPREYHHPSSHYFCVNMIYHRHDDFLFF